MRSLDGVKSIRTITLKIETTHSKFHHSTTGKVQHQQF